MAYHVSDLAMAFRLLISEDAPPENTAHPDQEALLAYLECRLPDEDSQRVRDHLALCSLCTGRLLDWQEDFEEQVAANLDEEWSRFRQNLSQLERRKHKALRALERLATLREGLPPVDAVEVIRSVRGDATDRETD